MPRNGQEYDNAGFWLAGEFPRQAEPLRASFERGILAGAGDGLTPLSFAYLTGRYRFLTAGASHFFGKEELAAFTGWLTEQSKRHVPAEHFSTPQVRLYVGGCGRSLARDDAAGGWRYCFSLSTGSRAGQMEFLGRCHGARSFLRLGRVSRLRLGPGTLVIHDARGAYGVRIRGNPDPLGGLVYLDGFLW